MQSILVATGIFPPDIGGPATMLKALADSLVKAGFKIQILTYAQRKIKEENSYDIYRVNINSVFAKIKYFCKMFKLSKQSDIIYVTDTYSVGRFAYYIKKLINKKYILRFTGDSAWEISRSQNWTKDYILNFQDRKYNSKSKKLKSRRTKILLNADKIIVDCKFNKKLAQKILSIACRGVLAEANKIQVIYNSIDFKNYKIDKNKIQRIKNNYPGKIIMTACRLTLWKGVGEIVEVFAELKKQINNLNLLILGDGPELENLKAQTKKLNLENSIHFLGKISQDEINDYFSAADVFILNSQYEGLSHTLLEVMKIGTPIITTNCGGNPELISNNQSGLLVDYKNNLELQNAILKILNNSELANKFSDNAKEKVKEFKWNNVVNKTVEIIRNLEK